MKKSTKSIVIAGASVAVLVGILLALLFLTPQPSDNLTGVTYPTDANGEQYAVDSKGNVIPSVKDENGNIISAGIVTLNDRDVSRLHSVKVENEEISYEYLIEKEEMLTGSTDPNTGLEYTDTFYSYELVENEDIRLGQTALDSMIEDITNLVTTKIIDINGENLEEYGLDNPRIVITATYDDGQECIIKLGDDALGDTGVYIQYNDEKAVYLISNETADTMLYSFDEIISLEVIPLDSDSAVSEFVGVTLSGESYSSNPTIISNEDYSSNAYYMTTEGAELSNENSILIMDNLAGLAALEVLVYQPTQEQLEEYSLLNAVATISVEYSDETYVIKGAKADETNMAYLYSEELDCIYSIEMEKVQWINLSYDELLYEYFFNPVLLYTENFIINAEDKEYNFEVEEELIEDVETGDIVEETYNVELDGETVDTDSFLELFSYITIKTIETLPDETQKEVMLSGTPTLTIEAEFSIEAENDKVEFYNLGEELYLAVVDGVERCIIEQEYINKIIEDTKSLV